MPRHDFLRVSLTRGALSLSYASEAPSEISTEQNQEGFFSKAAGIISSIVSTVTNIASSILSWSISTFGNTAGKILGWLGIGTPALFLLWLIKKITGYFINKHIVSPLKRAVNKRTVDRYGKNVFKTDTLEYKRALTKRDIIRITKKYGFTECNNEYKDGFEVYTSWIYGVLTWIGVYFCEDGIRTFKGAWAQEEDYMSYETLRNDGDITMAYLRRWFEGFPDEFYNTLMELREA